MKEKHKLNIFPEMQTDDYARLLEDLKINGFDSKQPIYLYQDAIIDGWHREKACNELNITPVYKEFIGSDIEAFEYCMRTNNRRNLTSSQWACMAVEAEDIYKMLSEAAAKRKKATQAKKGEKVGEHQGAKVRQLIAQPLDPEDNKTRTILAKSFNTNRTYVDSAIKIKESNLEKFEEIKSGKKKITEVIGEIKKEQNEALKKIKPKKLKGLYDIIVIDPPWPMQKIEREIAPNQSKNLDYPIMTIEEIKNIKLPTAENCHLWLWTTHKFLPDSFEILKEWNLKYVCCFVWHKNGGFQPFNLPQYNCEFVLYARKGTPTFIDTKAFNVCFDADRGKHSEKPQQFYDTICRVTEGKRIDMFSRRKIEGFDNWGNESLNENK